MSTSYSVIILTTGILTMGKVNELIEKANANWEERNAKAVEDGEEACPPMLPLVRLKVRDVFIRRRIF